MLSSFSQDEMKEFEKFVASPFFSKGRDLFPLFKVIKSFYPGFNLNKDKENFTAEYIFKKLFPGKNFDPKASANLINTLTSELFKSGKEFLIQLELRNETSIKNSFLLHQLRKKSLYNEFEKENEKINATESKLKGGGVEYFMNKCLMSKASVEYFISIQDFQKAIEGVSKFSDYMITSAFISAFNCIEQKKISKNAYNLKTAVSIPDILIKYTDLNSFVADLKNTDNQLYPYIAISYLAYLMDTFPEEENYFYEMKKMVYENIELFNQKVRFILLGKLESYCVGKSMSNTADKFFHEEFEIYKKSLELDCYKYSKDDHLSLVNFRNFMYAAIDCNELDWLENFINKYTDELQSDHRENMKFYSLANLNYARKDYEKALEHLIKVKYEFFLFKIDVKALMFRIYFEMELYENAISVMNTMKQYIETTSDLSELFKKRYKNFVKFSNDLLKIRLSTGTKDYGLLKKKINEENLIISKNWLIAMC